jgi:tartrate dehydrogenase/decarboxylase/D-malate dehydrogenase
VLAPHRIAVNAGDGIGREVVPEGLRALGAAAEAFNVALELTYRSRRLLHGEQPVA